jgi:hypothetical protein
MGFRRLRRDGGEADGCDVVGAHNGDGGNIQPSEAASGAAWFNRLAILSDLRIALGP